MQANKTIVYFINTNYHHVIRKNYYKQYSTYTQIRKKYLYY
jgi:hypothetical protein